MSAPSEPENPIAQIALDLRRLLLLLRVAWPVAASWASQWMSRRSSITTVAVGLRQAFETLGLTYVKLGQFLAMRLDILPVEVCDELSRLFENVKPVDFQAIANLVETELGGPLEMFFSSFEPPAVAAASIAQVHEARTHAGLRVAVKVQRPGAQRLFEADMRNVKRVAFLADLLGLGGPVGIREMVAEFEQWTRQEFDFLLEGRSSERLRARATRFERIPAVHWPLTTRRVLTMEFVEGVSAARVAASRRSPNASDAVEKLLPHYDAGLAMHRLAAASLKHIFVDGLFHADIHPGNVLIRDDNSVALLDFGIIGELTAQRRSLLAAYYASLAAGRIDLCLRYYVQLWVFTPESDQRGFLLEMKPIILDYYRNATDPEATIESAHWGQVTSDTLQVARRHNVRSSLDLLLFFRAVGALHSTFIVLGADFFAELSSFLVQADQQRMRRDLEEVLKPETAAAHIGGAAQSIGILAKVVGGPLNSLQPALVQARRSGIGYRERAATVALTALSLAIAVGSTHSSHLTVVNALTIGGGLVMLAWMTARLWQTGPQQV